MSDMQHYATHVDSLKPTAAGSVLGINRVLVVLASDAEAAIEAARAEACADWDTAGYLLGLQEGQRQCAEQSHGHYMDGQRDMLAQAIAAVKAVYAANKYDAPSASDVLIALRGLNRTGNGTDEAVTP